MSRNILIVDDEEDVQAIAKLGLEMGAGETKQSYKEFSQVYSFVLGFTHNLPDSFDSGSHAG